MTNIEKKAVQHISEILENVNICPVYETLIDAIIEAGIDNAVRTMITSRFKSAMAIQMAKVDAAKQWADAMIND